MSRPARRVRGVILRAVLNGKVAVLLGSACLAPAVWLQLTDHRWEAWWTDGLALVCGATGLALILAGFGGRRVDWIDPDQGT